MNEINGNIFLVTRVVSAWTSTSVIVVVDVQC